MGLYGKYVLPKLIHLACGAKPTMRQREKVVPRAHGRTLEIGIGSGLNLPHYDGTKVSKVWGLDPSKEMIRMAARAAADVPFEVELVVSPGDEVPLDDHGMDTVVVTYTLCTIPDTEAALREIGRVLRPGGELIFSEHGAAPDPSVRRWQDRLNPVWKRLAGGCNLNRVIPAVLEEGGFRITSLDSMYIPGWRPASFHYWGAATPR